MLVLPGLEHSHEIACFHRACFYSQSNTIQRSGASRLNCSLQRCLSSLWPIAGNCAKGRVTACSFVSLAFAILIMNLSLSEQIHLHYARQRVKQNFHAERLWTTAKASWNRVACRCCRAMQPRVEIRPIRHKVLEFSDLLRAFHLSSHFRGNLRILVLKGAEKNFLDATFLENLNISFGIAIQRIP
jgi:hypothetical protein